MGVTSDVVAGAVADITAALEVVVLAGDDLQAAADLVVSVEVALVAAVQEESGDPFISRNIQSLISLD